MQNALDVQYAAHMTLIPKLIKLKSSVYNLLTLSVLSIRKRAKNDKIIGFTNT